jgi:hypothetical protein
MMGKQTRRPRLPGRILFELHLAPRAITITKFAAACGVSLKHMRAIVNGRAAITAPRSRGRPVATLMTSRRVIENPAVFQACINGQSVDP